ncbi:unnamed protein product [Dibothriocephalus latus]|uniref:Uncharacterized protein n=1 Tax=Dibothriocephalus latus TaxID=60516 RepID=A0A3P7LEJ2_DIBLA|nr:unnamed protein product [Dibothriocephalus latus]
MFERQFFYIRAHDRKAPVAVDGAGRENGGAAAAATATHQSYWHGFAVVAPERYLTRMRDRWGRGGSVGTDGDRPLSSMAMSSCGGAQCPIWRTEQECGAVMSSCERNPDRV